MNDRDEDLDAFWDADALMPKKKRPAAPLAAFASTVRTADVTVPAGAPEKSADDRDKNRLTVPPRAEDGYTETAYAPDGNRLLLSVRIGRRENGYNFYGQFRRDAERYLAREGEECPFAPFFSYIPQYSQLNNAQRAYYFYWRSRVRAGEFLRCEESYLYLYVYEIINLPDLVPPQSGVHLLSAVWAAYRETFPRMDKYLTEWLCDYCLVHRLPCPSDDLRRFLPAVLPHASLKEFYLGGMNDLTPEGIETALAFFCDYRFRESRYVKEDPSLEAHIVSAVTPVIRDAFAESGIGNGTERSTVTREAFCGSLCAHGVRCRLTVEYIALGDVTPLRATVTAAVKYAENRLRAMKAVKSRLAVPAFALRYKEEIDRYFDGLTPAVQKPSAELPAYEKLYDAPSRGTDFGSAAEIERLSWDTTRILVPDDGTEEERVSAAPVVSSPEPETAPGAYPHGLTEEEGAYLRALLAGDRAAVRAILANGRIEDELADAINEKCAVSFGDVILEAVEDGYGVIGDYTEEVEEWLT